MKRSMIKYIEDLINCMLYKLQCTLLLVVLICFSASTALLADDFQENNPARTRLTVTCTQLENNQVSIEALIRASIDKQYVGILNAEVEFYKITDSVNVLLNKKISDKKGSVKILINAKEQLSVNEDGYFGILISYEGNEKYKSTENELLFRPAVLEIEAEEIDSVKMVTVKIYENNKEALPVEGAEVVLSVPRMFSNLPIASDFTDEDGMVSFEFPNDLPGGESGELSIIARADDTDEWASLQNQVENNWGVPASKIVHQERELWTPDAPRWMVITFSFLMIMVWGHFIIIIYKLFIVHKEGKALVSDKN